MRRMAPEENNMARDSTDDPPTLIGVRSGGAWSEESLLPTGLNR